jgi:hypothetical protein
MADLDHQARPNEVRWFNNDPAAGKYSRRAGMQSYRIEDGKLVETWITLRPLGTTWTDAVAQEHWTSAPPNK